MWIVLFSKITPLEYNVSTILTLIFFWPAKMTLRLVLANATCRCQKKACETDFLRTLILVAKFIYTCKINVLLDN